MADLFSKPLNQATAEDVRKLVAEAVPEGSNVEFKETLPCKRGLDPWCAGSSSVGDHARDAILEEVIAFANTHGGHVVLGIRESEDEPHCAVGIEPLPNCDELAARFRLFLRDVVDPQIPTVQVQGVRIDGESGVVVFRVPQSRMAPHRHKSTLHCYYRHADRTEKMTMREIQDLTLNLSRGLAAVEEAFAKRRADFERWAGGHKAPAIRATAVPLSPLFSGPIPGSRALFPPWRSCSLTINGKSLQCDFPVTGYAERPVLRGGRRYTDGSMRVSIVQEAYTDGLIEMRMARLEEIEGRFVFFEWIISVVGNVLLMADSFRQAVGSPDVEYGIELQLFDPLGGLSVYGPNTRTGLGKMLAHAVDAPGLFPRYAFAPNQIGSLIQNVVRDVLNAAGDNAPSGPYMFSWNE